MPGAGMKALNTIHPIIGVDMHRTLPPPLPVLPFAPHVVLWGEGWSQQIGWLWAVANSKACSPQSLCPKPVGVCYGYGIGRGHDAGPHPGHIWANALLPLIGLGSGSKSEFASGTVRLPTGNMAIAVAMVVNFNLDCNDFPIPPTPTGTVMAFMCTVQAGFTLGDFLGGLCSMVVDMAIVMVAGLVVGAAMAALSALGRGLLGGFMSALFGGQGFLGAFGRGLGRGLIQNAKAMFSVSFVSSLAPSALAAALASAAKQIFTVQTLKAFPWITGPAGLGTSVYGVGSPLGYSDSNSVYGTKSKPDEDQKKAHPDQHDPNARANEFGHSLAGEKPESSSSYHDSPRDD
jgi:hypothetical protein